MTVDPTLKDAISGIMADRRQRSAKEIRAELDRQGMSCQSAAKIARTCASIPGIQIVGRWNNRSEYRMVD